MNLKMHLLPRMSVATLNISLFLDECFCYICMHVEWTKCIAFGACRFTTYTRRVFIMILLFLALSHPRITPRSNSLPLTIRMKMYIIYLPEILIHCKVTALAAVATKLNETQNISFASSKKCRSTSTWQKLSGPRFEFFAFGFCSGLALFLLF